MESPTKRAQRFGTKTRQSRQSSPLSTVCTPKRGQRAAASSSTSVHGDFFSSNDEVVIFSCITQPIVVTFNTTSYYHTIWVLRHDQKEIRKRSSGPKDKRRKPDLGESLLSTVPGLNHFNSSDEDRDDDFDGNSKLLHSTLMHPRTNLSNFTPLDPDETAQTVHSNVPKLQNQVF